MFTLPKVVKRHWKPIIVLYFLSGILWGPMAEAAIRPEPVEVAFLDIAGLATAPKDVLPEGLGVPRDVLRRPAASPSGNDFWRALANCESSDGRSTSRYVGYFQFSRDTARKVGIDGSESYEEQRAAAQSWARRIDNPGSRSGWPVCYWVAKRNS